MSGLLFALSGLFGGQGDPQQVIPAAQDQVAALTMSLMGMLVPKVGFDAPPDIEIPPEGYEIDAGDGDAEPAGIGEDT